MPIPSGSAKEMNDGNQMDLDGNEVGPPKQEPRALCVEESCQRLSEYLAGILRNARQAHLDLDSLDPSCRVQGERLRSFQVFAQELSDYATQLSRGSLSQPIPQSESCLYDGPKNLHANLKHLTWQAEQEADGDYTQHIAYFGEFSSAFNTMTQQLRQREIQLTQELEKAQRRANIIDGYTDMLWICWGNEMNGSW